ncbi:MAG TPA: histone deacetylase [Humisphaera sp.]
MDPIASANAGSPVGKATVARWPTALVYDGAFKEHLTDDGHPERPARYDAVMGALAAAPYFGRVLHLPPRPATDEDLVRCHSPEYLDVVAQAVAAGERYLPTGDTLIGPRSLDVARLAAGAVLQAVDAVADGRVRNAFCVVRPPGHHANTYRGSGFCVFNNVAVGARYAQSRHGIERVLIVDWDVHHGNGTQDVFYRDDSVLFFSTHQSPWYPSTGHATERGAGRGEGYTVNCPLPAGAGRAEVVRAFAGKLRPAAERFRPQLVMISAGFDSRDGDPLGRFRLTDDDFAELTHLVTDIADDHAGGRVVSVLEGGYNLAGLASAAASHVGALVAAATPSPPIVVS